jgi:hypothetical protein
VFVHLALHVPDVEACDVKLDPASRRVTILHHRLGVGHGLPAAVAGLPVARAAAHARDGGVWQAARRELFLNQETKDGLVHGGLRAVRISTRQIHRSLGAKGATTQELGCRLGDSPTASRDRLVDVGPPCPPGVPWLRRHGRDAGGGTVAFDGADITNVPDRGYILRAAASR